MARIPDEELRRLKHDIPIERLATARGVVLKPSGNNLIGLCPFRHAVELLRNGIGNQGSGISAERPTSPTPRRSRVPRHNFLLIKSPVLHTSRW